MCEFQKLITSFKPNWWPIGWVIYHEPETPAYSKTIHLTCFLALIAASALTFTMYYLPKCSLPRKAQRSNKRKADRFSFPIFITQDSRSGFKIRQLRIQDQVTQDSRSGNSGLQKDQRLQIVWEMLWLLFTVWTSVITDTVYYFYQKKTFYIQTFCNLYKYI